MKGLFVVLLCATVGYCVTGSPLPQVLDSEADSTVFREAKELPVPGRFQGGFIRPKTRVNPFLSKSQQHQIPSGGHIHQQLGGKPIAGGLINQQSEIKPAAGSLQGGLIIQQQQQPPLNTFLQGSQQLQTPSSGLAMAQPEVNPFLQGTQHQHGGLINKQTKVLPEVAHVHVTDAFTSRNAGVHVKDTLHEKPIEILSQDSDLYPDGSHFNVWESANGIKVQEEGTVKVIGKDEVQSVSGSISYTDADGTPIHLTYIADENGFQPQGDHLPTPPPIPQSVARALEYIAAHPWVDEDHIKKQSKVPFVKEELPIIEVA